VRLLIEDGVVVISNEKSALRLESHDLASGEDRRRNRRFSLPIHAASGDV
jgi:hypothetical protein